MYWPTSVILLLAWLSSSAAEDPVSNPDVASTTICDENWVHSKGFCYFFSGPYDVVNFAEAPHKCLLSDAEYAYPGSPEELNFLQSQIKTKETYGWSVNVVKSFGTYSRNQIHMISDDSSIEFTPLPDTIPTVQKAYDQDNKCVALHLQKSYIDTHFEISTEPCEILLRVVCQGKKSEHPHQEIDFVQNFIQGELLFWFSVEFANKTAATKICKSKAMELVYNVEELLAGFNGSYDGIPWWAGITIDQNGPKPENGAKADLSSISWLNLDPPGYFSKQLVLLHSGKARYIQHSFDDSFGLPYICKKRATVSGVYSCPYQWIRAGRSCYSISHNSYNVGSLPWLKAKETCEKRGSHLLSINSLDEKLWIELVALKHVHKTWTSANDLTTEGKFTWHDGSDIDNKLLPWLKAPFGDYWSFYESKCVTIDIMFAYIYPTSCRNTEFPACQYELPQGETDCHSNWKELDGTCYTLFTSSNSMVTYDRLSMYCQKYSHNLHAKPLVVKTRKVADFISTLKDLTSHPWPYVWLGMHLGDTMDSWRWEDGSGDKVDFSVFNITDEPDNGGGEKPENCVAINKMMHAYDSQCDQRMPYICEKDLAPVSALGPLPDSVATLRVMAFVPIASALACMLAVLWL